MARAARRLHLPDVQLIPVLTAFQNVELPLLLTKLSKSQRKQHVETALSVVGCPTA